MNGKSPLAPKRFPAVPPVAGVELAGGGIGLKKRRGAKDLMIARLAPGTTIAGVVTRSRCPSAPVEWCRAMLPGGRARAIVANSGSANAFTGNGGRDVVAKTAAAAASLFKCKRQEVFVASTGVIGKPLPVSTIAKGLPTVARALSPTGWRDAAEAIRTTDTFPKAAWQIVRIGDSEVVVAGISKGSGMIAPDMGTALGFLFTDAAIAAPILQKMLRAAADESFNSVTVDGDTSTSDTLLLCATGKARHAGIDAVTGPLVRDFRNALHAVSIDLAQQIVRDGEGAQKFVTVTVGGAASKVSARRIAQAIANSPLVKTAIAGEDANWGRIVMAVGKAGEPADRDKLRIAIGDVPITAHGYVRPDYVEAPLAEYMRGRDIVIEVDVGVGRGRATVWTCDLTHGYISINADYRS